MAVEKVNEHKSPPPVSDEWRPNHKKHKKKHGLIIFMKPWNYWLYETGVWTKTKKVELFESVSWYTTERDRDNAIAKANKDMNGKWSVPLALAKIER